MGTPFTDAERHPVAWAAIWLLVGIPVAWVAASGLFTALPPEIPHLGVNIYPHDMRVFVAGFLLYAMYALFLSTWIMLRVKNMALRRFVWWAWAIIPPLWFAIEYFFLYPVVALDPIGSFDAFKYGQGVASKLWAAGVAMASAAHFVTLSRERREGRETEAKPEA